MNSPQFEDNSEQPTQSPDQPIPILQIVGDSDSDIEDSDSQHMASGEPRMHPARSYHPPARLIDFVHH